MEKPSEYQLNQAITVMSPIIGQSDITCHTMWITEVETHQSEVFLPKIH